MLLLTPSAGRGLSWAELNRLRGHQVEVGQVPSDPNPGGKQPEVDQQVPARGTLKWEQVTTCTKPNSSGRVSTRRPRVDPQRTWLRG